MKKILIVIAIVASVIVLALFVMARISKNGQPPGIVEGRLAPCPGTPNCVCSEFRADESHYIEPIALKAESAHSANDTIRAAIIEQGGVIGAERDDYLATTFGSRLFGFVDDVEIRIDREQAVIHVRSASRVGRGDLGANRKRVERLRHRILNEVAANP